MIISITQRGGRPLRWAFLTFLLALVLVDVTSSSAFAADSMSSHSSLFDWGSATAGSGGKGLNDELKSILITLEQAAKAISVIMTVVAGAMVCLNLQDGRKVIWNYILGIGLAINFGAFLFTMFGQTAPISTSVTVTHIDNSQLEQMVKLKTQGHSDILSTFMAYFSSVLYANTDTVLKPIAFRLTLILATIDASVKLAMDLISGDKVKFMITTCLKVGFYLFLINEWLAIAPAVAVWFQNMGFMLGGMDPAQGGSLHADSIVDDAVTMVQTLVGAGNGSQTADTGILDKASKFAHRTANAFLNTITGATLLQIICMIITVIAIILTAIEMFMARIEFYVMMAISTILLPFGVIDKLNFLAKGAISSVFNTGAKVMIIAFIQAIGTNLMHKYVTEYVDSQGTSIGPNFPVLLQILLFSLVLLIITKKIPQLAQGFLNGQPALDGGSMKDLAMKTAKSAGEAAKAVTTHGASLAGRAVGAGAKAYGDASVAGETGKSLAMSTLKGGAANFAKGLALEAMTKNPVSSAIGGAFANGLKATIGREGTMPYVDGKLFGEKSGDKKAGPIASLLHRGKTSALAQYGARKAYDYQSGEDPFTMLDAYSSGQAESQVKAREKKDKEGSGSPREPLTADQKEQEMNSLRRHPSMSRFTNGAYGTDSGAYGTANGQNGASDSSKMSNTSQTPSSSSGADSGAHASSSADSAGSSGQSSASDSSQMSNTPQTPSGTSGADSGAHASSSAGGAGSGSTPAAGQGASAGSSKMSNTPQTPSGTTGADSGAKEK